MIRRDLAVGLWNRRGRRGVRVQSALNEKCIVYRRDDGEEKGERETGRVRLAVP